MTTIVKIIHKGFIYPKVWEIARKITKLRDERNIRNLGSGTMSISVFNIDLPEGTVKSGSYYITPKNIRLYQETGDQYRPGFLISEKDKDKVAEKYFK